MAGSNRSGDLKDAQRSIPLGTVCATLATSLLYILSTLVFGAVSERGILSAKNELLFTAVVSWPSEYVVRVGIVLSSFGAATLGLCLGLGLGVGVGVGLCLGLGVGVGLSLEGP